MKVTTLHISDCHFREESPDYSALAAEIACSMYERARESSLVLILLTGDIAFSGRKSEYDKARAFVGAIKDALTKETTAPVEVIACPGNHDCVLVPENKPRSLIINTIVGEPELAKDSQLIELCTSAQSDYFAFREQVTQAAPVYDHKLWTEYEFAIDKRRVRVSALNAAWMSRLPEVPGELVFPVQLFADALAAQCDLRLVLIHHPLNWYNQPSYRPLRSALRSHAHAFFSGHEHEPASGATLDNDLGDSYFSEAGFLESASGHYSVLTFDLDASSVSERRYTIAAGRVASDVQHGPKPIVKKGALAPSGLMAPFESRLQDPGATFVHPYKDKLALHDVFVFPELKIRSSEDVEDTISSQPVLDSEAPDRRLLIYGDEMAGKTTLLLTAFDRYRQKGLVPLYLDARTLRGASASDVEKKVARSINEQYQAEDIVQNAPKAKKLLLVDDLEELAQTPKVLSALIDYAQKHFASVICTADEAFQMGEFASDDISKALSAFDQYELLPFGFKLRKQLARKWVQCGRNPTKQELDVLVHGVESDLQPILWTLGSHDACSRRTLFEVNRRQVSEGRVRAEAVVALDITPQRSLELGLFLEGARMQLLGLE